MSSRSWALHASSSTLCLEPSLKTLEARREFDESRTRLPRYMLVLADGVYLEPFLFHIEILEQVAIGVAGE